MNRRSIVHLSLTTRYYHDTAANSYHPTDFSLSFIPSLKDCDAQPLDAGRKRWLLPIRHMVLKLLSPDRITTLSSCTITEIIGPGRPRICTCIYWAAGLSLLISAMHRLNRLVRGFLSAARLPRQHGQHGWCNAAHAAVPLERLSPWSARQYDLRRSSKQGKSVTF